MEFTKTPPSEPGFYWFRGYFRDAPLGSDREPTVLHLVTDALVFQHRDSHGRHIDEFTGEWYGPLQLPSPFECYDVRIGEVYGDDGNPATEEQVRQLAATDERLRFDEAVSRLLIPQAPGDYANGLITVRDHGWSFAVRVPPAWTPRYPKRGGLYLFRGTVGGFPAVDIKFRLFIEFYSDSNLGA
jgi:hypothetical protein